ncbi:MAG: metallophosphoesterase [Clostridia bacterium]|nr:metallophosphoesterase [Clostridia bacterium]
MRVFAIADLHLSLSDKNKAMDKFGRLWENHTERLYEAWQDTVAEGDLVLVAGDISWAMYFEDAEADLNFIHSLKGTKVLLRGNHDFWWPSYRKLCAALPPSIHAIQNNALRFSDVSVCGSRGWTTPESSNYKASVDEKLFLRECIRLKLSASCLSPDTQNLAMLHYPPFSEKGQPSGFVDILEEAGVSEVVYGHLHGRVQGDALTSERNGINYHLVAADYLSFVPKLII